MISFVTWPALRVILAEKSFTPLLIVINVPKLNLWQTFALKKVDQFVKQKDKLEFASTGHQQAINLLYNNIEHLFD